MFIGSRHSISSIFVISQDYYKHPETTIEPDENLHQIFGRNNFRDVQNLYQDKASMALTLNEYKLVTSGFWVERY